MSSALAIETMRERDIEAKKHASELSREVVFRIFGGFVIPSWHKLNTKPHFISLK